MRLPDCVTRVLRRILPVLGCALALGACTSWAEVPTPAPAARHEVAGPVRVTRHDGVSLTLRDPYVKGDTLYGNDSEIRTAVALRDVKAIRRREVHALRSAGMVAVVVAAGVGALIATVFYDPDY